MCPSFDSSQDLNLACAEHVEANQKRAPFLKCSALAQGFSFPLKKRDCFSNQRAALMEFYGVAPLIIIWILASLFKTPLIMPPTLTVRDQARRICYPIRYTRSCSLQGALHLDRSFVGSFQDTAPPKGSLPITLCRDKKKSEKLMASALDRAKAHKHA